VIRVACATGSGASDSDYTNGIIKSLIAESLDIVGYTSRSGLENTSPRWAIMKLTSVVNAERNCLHQKKDVVKSLNEGAKKTMENIMNEAEQLDFLIPEGKNVLFVCIGSDRCTGDSLGPLVGSDLKKLGYTVMGTLGHTVNATNLEKTLEIIKEKYYDYFVVAIDACLGELKNVGKISIKPGPLKPGAGVGKDLPEVGDMHIVGIVNFKPTYSNYDFLVLQNTRLSVVMSLKERIVKAIDYVMKDRQEKMINRFLIDNPLREHKLYYDGRKEHA